MQVGSIKGDPVKPPPRPTLLQLAPFFLIAVPVFVWSQGKHLSDTWMEDLPVYMRAVERWLAGLDPYTGSAAPLVFLYPPAFLLIAGWISHLLPDHSGPAIYVALEVCAVCAMPLVLARYFFRQPWLSPLFALLLFFASPRFTGIEALRTMNIASLLYCLAFVAAIPGLRRNQWTWFYLAVFLASIVKITFLSLLLLPLLAGRRQWVRSILCGCAVVIANLAQRAFWPDLYGSYVASLRQGIVFNQSFGYGVFGILADYHYWERGIGVAAYVAATVLALALLTLMFWMRWRLDRAGEAWQDVAGNGVFVAMVVVTIILVCPRQMQYDIDIAVFAAFVLWIYALKTSRVLLWMVLLFLPSLAMPLVVSNPRLRGGYEVFLCLAAFALGYWRLNRELHAKSAIPAEVSSA